MWLCIYGINMGCTAYCSPQITETLVTISGDHVAELAGKCFPGHAEVQTQHGAKSMGAVRLGDKVCCHLPDEHR